MNKLFVYKPGKTFEVISAWFRGLTIAKKLWFNIGFLIIMLSFSSIISYVLIREINQKVRQIVTIEEPLEASILEIEISIGETAKSVLAYIRDHDEKHLENYSKSKADFSRFAKEFENLAKSYQDKLSGVKVAVLYANIQETGDDIIQLTISRNQAFEAFKSDIKKINEFITRYEELTLKRTSRKSASLELQVKIDGVFVAVAAFIAQQDPKIEKEIKSKEINFKEYLRFYKSSNPSREEVEILNAIEDIFDRAIGEGYFIVHNSNQLNIKLASFNKKLEEVDSVLDDEIQPMIRSEALKYGEEAVKSGTRAILIVVGTGMLIIFLLWGTTWSVSRRVVDSIEGLQEGAEKIGKGDLDHRIKIGGSLDEFGNLAKSFNLMAKQRLDVETQQRVLEAQLRQSQKMETVGTLAGGIAHDFNNILTPIFGHTELAMRKMTDDDPIKKNLEAIWEGTHRAKGLVQQILTFSRKNKPDWQNVELYIIVKEVLKLLKSSIPSTITVTGRIDEKSGFVHADITQMHQVIMNICTNAWQALEDETGEIIISLAQVILDEQHVKILPQIKPGDYIKLSIQDTGVGMENETLSHIFEPFYTTKEVGKGTGLGLSVVHGIIGSHKGDIVVESIPGRGTRFDIYLPRIEKVEQKKKIKVTTPVGSENILLVDDQPEVVEIIKMILEEFGYHVSDFTKPKKLLKAFKQDPGKYDILITDQTMPKITGLQLAKKLKKIVPGFPVILITGYTSDGENKQQDSYCDKVVLKPIVSSEIGQAIRELLD